MFPGAGAQVYYNDAGEVIGWDYPDSYEPDLHEDWFDDGPKFKCACGEEFVADSDDDILAHHEICEQPEWLRSKFPDIEFPK